MKFLNILFLLAVATVAGGFVWFAITDVPIEQSMVNEAIPNERFIEK